MRLDTARSAVENEEEVWVAKVIAMAKGKCDERGARRLYQIKVENSRKNKDFLSTTSIANRSAVELPHRKEPPERSFISEQVQEPAPPSTSEQIVLVRQKIEEGNTTISLFDIAPWPDHMRAIPNDLGRSAIFTIRNKRVPRNAYQRAPIFHFNKEMGLTYTGIELRADDDELVFAQVLEYAKRTPLGEPVTFTLYALCRDINWSINGRYYQKAEECLTRLQSSVLQFTSQRLGRLESISLIKRFRILNRDSRSSSQCEIEIDTEISALFAGRRYTKFIWEKYCKLSSTARRMYDYLGSHKEPHPLKLETFRQLCGSTSEIPYKWRQQVKRACNDLQRDQLVKMAWVANDLIHCKR